ncbi:MAG TPA: hypothetical protein VFS42_08035 [Burkholderiaceae bacterium]|nr:hypothetical protein [Burkholderiaceae bacterium]
MRRVGLSALIGAWLVTGCSALVSPSKYPPAPISTDPVVIRQAETEGAPTQQQQRPFPLDQVARIDALLLLERDLLRLAPDIARIRWNDKAPIGNRDDDDARTAAAMKLAVRYQIDPVFVRDVFTALTQASNFAQSELHKQWREQRRPPLLTLTRTPAQVQSIMDGLVPRIVQALANAGPALRTPGAYAMIEARAAEAMPSVSALAEPTRRRAIKPLLDRAAR